MSVAIQYETLEEAEMRLRGTVIFYEGEPVFVYKITQGTPLRVHFVPLPLVKFDLEIHKDPNLVEAFRVDGRTSFVAVEGTRKFISSRNFDYGVSKVGFVPMENNEAAPIWVGRNTQRQYRQGLTGRTCDIMFPKDGFESNLNNYNDLAREESSFTYLLTQESFVQALKGNYGGQANDKIFKVLSRDFMQFRSKDFDLTWLYSNNYKRIGLRASNNLGAFVIPRKYKYFSEQLVEAGIPHMIKDN
jgi:hypothetical protein